MTSETEDRSAVLRQFSLTHYPICRPRRGCCFSLPRPDAHICICDGTERDGTLLKLFKHHESREALEEGTLAQGERNSGCLGFGGGAFTRKMKRRSEPVGGGRSGSRREGTRCSCVIGNQTTVARVEGDSLSADKHHSPTTSHAEKGVELALRC